MMNPSLARSLVCDLAAPGDWRIAYNFRKQSFTPERRSTIKTVGALSFQSPQAAKAATLYLHHADAKHTDHPLKHHFEYDVDSYEYNPDVDNYSIFVTEGGKYKLNASRGIHIVGAFCFPKDRATEYVNKLNNREIIL